jgi:hypothetical protein
VCGEEWWDKSRILLEEIDRRVTKKLLSRALLCFGRHVKPFVPAVFAVVSTHHPALRVVGYGPSSLWVIHKESLCLSSGDINRLMMMNTTRRRFVLDAYFVWKLAPLADE